MAEGEGEGEGEGEEEEEERQCWLVAGRLVGRKTGGRGRVAQWITRLTTDQKIPGSNPGVLACLVWAFITLTFARHLIVSGGDEAICVATAPRGSWWLGLVWRNGVRGSGWICKSGPKVKSTNGVPGHRSQYLSHAKRALYHLS